MPTHRRLFVFCMLTLAFAGCREAQVTSYRVPKEKDPELPAAAANAAANPGDPAGAAMANTPVATASGAGLTWVAPAHWKAKPASAMRKGSFAVPGEGGVDADLSITAFPGDVGGDLANLNRWRGQIQLPPIAAAEFGSATQHVDLNGLHLTVVDIAGTGANAQRILGAMIPFGGATWFIKLLGPDAVVAREKAAFTAFLATVKPSAP
jgi:hypothetical protein